MLSSRPAAMEVEDDDLGASTSFGLNRVLASSGVDPAAFSDFFSRTGGTSSGAAFADVDANSDEDRYEDDVSDAELPAENVEEVRARQREQASIRAEEARWYRRAMEMQQDEGKKKVQEKVMNEVDMVKEVWPDFQKGRRLRMSEVFYETPKQRRGWEAGFTRRKRRKIGTQDCESDFSWDQRGKLQLIMMTDPLKIAPDPSVPPDTAFLLPALPSLPVYPPTLPRYNTPLGAYFESDWIKGAKQIRRMEMTQTPEGFDLEADLHTEKCSKTLDLACWEQDIVMCSL